MSPEFRSKLEKEKKAEIIRLKEMLSNAKLSLADSSSILRSGKLTPWERTEWKRVHKRRINSVRSMVRHLLGEQMKLKMLFL